MITKNNKNKINEKDFLALDTFEKEVMKDIEADNYKSVEDVESMKKFLLKATKK